MKDRIDPSNQGVRVDVDAHALAAIRPSYRWLAYTNQARGIPVPADLPGDDRPDLVESFWLRASSWFRAE